MEGLMERREIEGDAELQPKFSFVGVMFGFLSLPPSTNDNINFAVETPSDEIEEKREEEEKEKGEEEQEVEEDEEAKEEGVGVGTPPLGVVGVVVVVVVVVVEGVVVVVVGVVVGEGVPLILQALDSKIYFAKTANRNPPGKNWIMILSNTYIKT